MEQELPGRGPLAGVQLQTAEDEVPEGGGDGGGNLGGSGSARNLKNKFLVNMMINIQSYDSHVPGI